MPYTTGALAIALIASALRARARNDQHNGMMLGLSVWACAVLLTALPVLTYLVPYSASVDRFIAVCLLLAALGYNVVRKPSIAPPAPLPKLRADVETARWLGSVGILGNSLLLIYAMQHGTKLGPSYLLHNLSSIRSRNFELATAGVHGPIGLLGTFLAACSYLYLIVAARLKVSRILTFANFSLIILVGLFFYGGRQTIFVAALLVGVALWVRGAKLRVKPRTIVLALVAILSVWFFTTSFVSHRQTSTDPRLLLRVTGRADYGPWTRSRAYADPKFGSELLQYSYLSTPIPSLMYYINSGLAPGPLFGAYSLPTPTIFVRLALGTYSADEWTKARVKVFRPYSATGYLSNAWATILRDLVVDFGEVGAVAFCGMLGVFMAWARNRYEDTGEVFYHALEVYATITLAFGAFQSLLYPDYMANGFFLAWAIVIVRHLASPLGSRRARARPLGAWRPTHSEQSETGS